MTGEFPLGDSPIQIQDIIPRDSFNPEKEASALKERYPKWWHEHRLGTSWESMRFKVEILFRIEGSQHSNTYPTLAEKVDKDFQRLLSWWPCNRGDFREYLKVKGENLPHLAEHLIIATFFYITGEIAAKLSTLGRKISEPPVSAITLPPERVTRDYTDYRICLFYGGRKKVPHSFITDISRVIFEKYLPALMRGEDYDILAYLKKRVSEYSPREEIGCDSRNLCSTC